MKNVLRNIKSLRKERKISQANMAKLLNMFQANYSKLEQGTTDMTLSRLQSIADILGVSIYVLIGKEEHSSNNDIEKELKELREENKRLNKKTERLDDYSERLKRDLDFFKILFTEHGFSVIIILQAILNVSKLIKEKIKAIKYLDDVADLNLSNEIYCEFKGILEFGQFDDFKLGIKNELNKSVIDSPISVLDTLVNSENILKMIFKEENISLFRKEYYIFLDRYEKQQKENMK